MSKQSLKDELELAEIECKTYYDIEIGFNTPDSESDRIYNERKRLESKIKILKKKLGYPSDEEIEKKQYEKNIQKLINIQPKIDKCETKLKEVKPFLDHLICWECNGTGEVSRKKYFFSKTKTVECSMCCSTSHYIHDDEHRLCPSSIDSQEWLYFWKNNLDMILIFLEFDSELMCHLSSKNWLEFCIKQYEKDNPAIGSKEYVPVPIESTELNPIIENRSTERKLDLT